MLNKALYWGRITADESELVGTQRPHRGAKTQINIKWRK